MENMAAVHSNTLDPFSRDVASFNDRPQSPPAPASNHMATPQVFHDHLRSSNLRGAESNDGNQDNLPAISPTRADLALTTTTEKAELAGYTDQDPISAMSEMSVNPEEMKGYAQLVFPDGEYLVTSTEIMLGRDERAQQILKDQEKRERREQREQALLHARQYAAELSAQQAIDEYKSENGSDGERRPSSHSLLEGRPAPGLPSTFSETGGIVNYEGSVDNIRRKRHKRNFLLSRSSSTNSIAPASLHVYGAAAAPWSGDEDNKCIFLPIHPFQADDIRKISKEHLRIFYDAVEKQWRMEIKGNGAFVFNELYSDKNVDEQGVEDTAPRHFKRGDTVILTHNTEVLITSLHFVFKLPQRRGFSTLDSDDSGADDELDDESKLQASDEDSELSEVEDVKQEPDAETEDIPKRPKIFLKASKKRQPSEEPDIPVVTGGKGKKKPSDAQEMPPPPQQPTEPPTAQAPPVFDANSTLQHVPVNELPEKRKGPGRPPKNGLVSKRDEGIIRRKMKEYEKRGERPPAYKDILAMVRAENRAKEIAAKAAARGEPIPPQQLEMMAALPTTETDGQVDTTPTIPAAAQPSIEPAESVEAVKQGSQEVDDIAKTSQQQRTFKSPSPMKPKEEYTEEQLKRPTQTYYYILDEILTEGPEDAMELQQIYDKICKKYPFYKYVVESTGWQSSVRHNLKQNERFKPVSKQGKGWLWSIDPSIPLEKAKERPRAAEVPRDASQYPRNGMPQPGVQYNGYAPAYQQMPPGQQPYTTQGTYGQTYAQPPAQPQYAQNGAPMQSTVPQHGHPPVYRPPQTVRPSSNTPSRPASNTPQPAAGPLPPAFQDLVEEIMRFRVEYLTPFQKDPQQHAVHERIFKRCVEWISALHMKQSPDLKFENEEEKRVFQILEQMRHKFEQGASAPPQIPQQVQALGQHAPTQQYVSPATTTQPQATTAAPPQHGVASATEVQGISNGVNSATHVQPPQSITAQPQVAATQPQAMPVPTPPVQAPAPPVPVHEFVAEQTTATQPDAAPAALAEAPAQLAVASTDTEQVAGTKRTAEGDDEHDEKRIKI